MYCILVFLCSCGTSKPTNFYALTSTLKSDVDVVYSIKEKTVVVDPILIPNYLQRAQIVSKDADGIEVKIDEFNRWIEPLSDSTQRVVTENLSYYLPNSFVRNTISNRMPYDYRVSVEINKIDVQLGDKMVLSATWIVADKQKPLIKERSVYEAKIDKTYEDMAKKQSEMLNELSKEISQRMKKLK